MARIDGLAELATRMAAQRLSPGVLDEGLRWGVFLAG